METEIDLGGRRKPGLLGRDDELDKLTDTLRHAKRGSRVVAILEGEAGIGKSRLFDELHSMAASEGFQSIRAVCQEGFVRPCGPLIDGLRSSGQIVTTEVSTSEYRLVEEVTDHVEAQSVNGALLVSVDDLQWADPSTLTVLRRMTSGLVSRPVAIVVAVRSEYSAHVAKTIDDLLRRGAEFIRLGALSDEDSAQLVADVAGRPPGAALLELLRGASGNPFYLVELTRSLKDEDLLGSDREIAEIVGHGLPSTFRSTIIRRLRSLSEQAVQIVEAGAILGLAFMVEELSASLGRSASDLAATLREAMKAGFFEDSGDRIRFTHSLVHQAIYQEIPPSLRRRLHRETAQTLAAHNVPPDRIATHIVLGATRGDESATRWLRDAAAHTRREAPKSAAAMLEQARAIMSPTDPDRDELLSELAMAWATTGRLRDAETLASEILSRGVPPAVAGRLIAGMVYALTWQGRPRQAVVESRALERQVLPSDRILLDAQGAVAEILTNGPNSAGPRIKSALDAARQPGHSMALCHALCAATREQMLMGNLDESVSLGNEAVRLAESDPSLAPAQPWFFFGLALTVADRAAEAETVAKRGREVAEQLGLVWGLPLYMSYLANVQWLTGRFDDAIAEDEAGKAIADEFDMNIAIISASSSRLARIALHRGMLDKADEALTEAEDWLVQQGSQSGDALVLTAKGLLIEARGDLPSAIDLFTRAWERNKEAGITSEVRLIGPDLVRMTLAQGRDDDASLLVSEIEKMGAQLGVPSALGASLRCRGLLHRDADVLTQAADSYRRSPRVVELAQTCEDAAIQLAEVGRKKEANEFLHEASQIFMDLKASRDLKRLRSSARRLGLSGPPRSTRPSTGWESLTESERRVALLVADGSTNREVAEALVISSHTVDSHLRHVFAKLSITSRVQLASIVAKQGGENTWP